MIKIKHLLWILTLISTIWAGPLCAQTICVGDFVWNDLNRNGYQDQGEGGLVTTITLYKYETNEFIASTTSNANGFYTFCQPASWDIFRLHFASIAGYSRSPLLEECSRGCIIYSDNKADINGNIYLVFLGSNDGLDAGYYQTPLPVHLKEFAIKKGTQNKTTFLKWITYSESNNKGWEIQRSSQSSSWETIGWTDGAANSSEEKIYNYTDFDPQYGLNYYRLKQIDYDGKTAYSEVKNMEFHTDEISLYPNPIVDRVYISGIAVDARFMIHDINGRIILEGKLINDYIDVSGLMAGSYVLRVDNGVKISHHRVVKL